MARYALVVEYDGTDFEGWQSQPSSNTVQDHLESALTTSLRENIRITGAGRTDAGVHAAFQVAHFDTGQELDVVRLFRSLNGLLPPAIAVRKVCSVAPDFHSRFDAVLRTYRYNVSLAPVALERTARVWLKSETSLELMNESCPFLIGKHDFSAFCRTQSETKNRVCTVETAAWVREDQLDSYFEISADRFLHGMVRAIVGSMLEIGRGRTSPEHLREILLTGDRTAAGPAAPSTGLVLYRIRYPDGSLPFQL